MFAARRFPIAILWTAALLSLQARADYSWQITGGVRNSDVGHSADAETATLAATYYFRPVDDTAGPYALAPFLNRSSRLQAAYDEDKTSALVSVASNSAFPLLSPPPSPPVTVTTRAAGRALSGRHVWRTSGWYVGASLAEAGAAQPALQSTSFSVLGDDLRSRSLAVGKYVAPSTTVELALEGAETTLTSELLRSCAFCSPQPFARITTTLHAEIENVGLSALHVGRFGRLRYSLSGGVTTSESDLRIDVVETPLIPQPPLPPPTGLFAIAGGVAAGNFAPISSERRERFALTGEIFPTPALGIRVGYARWDDDPSLDESYELGATWFFKRKIGAQVVLSRTKSDLPVTTTTDVEAVALQLIGRL